MNGKILVIDDDPKNIFALSATLKSRGFQCVSATSADDGIHLVKSHEEIRLVLLDMMMPGMDGYEALPLIKRERKVPVIAVTAQAMVGDREKCLAAGADDYLSKPVDVDRLFEVLANYLD